MPHDGESRRGHARSRREFIGGAAVAVAGAAAVTGVAGSAPAVGDTSVEPAVAADLARLARVIVAFLPPMPKLITDPRPSAARLGASLVKLPADRRSGVVTSARLLTRPGEPPFASLPDDGARARLIERSDHRRGSMGPEQPVAGVGDAVAFTIAAIAPSLSAASGATSAVVLAALPRYSANLARMAEHKAQADRQLGAIAHEVSPPKAPQRARR